MENHLVTPEQLAKSPLFSAIVELDSQINEPLELNVVGGFALILRDLREIEAVTDIDYVGADISPEIREQISNIGLKRGFQRDWINNDVLMSGTTLEDLEFSTGKLHFLPAFSLSHIQVNVLDARDLLRMKVIAVDTNLAAIDSTLGNVISSRKDLEDISRLMNLLHMTPEEVDTDFADYIVEPRTVPLIKTYIEKGLEEAVNMIETYRKESMIRYASRSETEPHSSILDDYINKAMQRREQEKEQTL